MYYEINVAHKGNNLAVNTYSHVFATAPRSITTREQAQKLLVLLQDKFPAVEGYQIRVTRFVQEGSDVTYSL